MTFDVANQIGGIDHHRINERGEWEMARMNARRQVQFIVRQ